MSSALLKGWARRWPGRAFKAIFMRGGPGEIRAEHNAFSGGSLFRKKRRVPLVLHVYIRIGSFRAGSAWTGALEIKKFPFCGALYSDCIVCLSLSHLSERLCFCAWSQKYMLLGAADKSIARKKEGCRAEIIFFIAAEAIACYTLSNANRLQCVLQKWAVKLIRKK